MAAGEVRIIGGKWRGRKLRFDAQPGLRPTLSRIRETLGNWLRAEWSEARCLDLFAGTGALGFEALSRGASCVTFVDRSARSTTRIKAHIQAFDAHTRARVITARSERFLRREPDAAGWNLVFLDPPFDTNLLRPTLDTLRERDSLLAPEGFVYVETARRGAEQVFAELGDWEFHRQSEAADVAFALLQRR